MPSPWRIEVATVATDRTVMNLTEATGVTFDRYIGKTGGMSCSVPIPNAAIARRVAPILRDDASLTLSAYIYRGADIWWSGFLGDADLQLSRTGDSVQLSGLGFESYPDDRTQMTDINWAQIEQLEIARQIWATLQVGRGNLGIAIPAVTPSGVLRDLQVRADEARGVGSILSEVSNRLNGFEWMIYSYWDGAARRRDLVLGYPGINVDAGGAISYPGAIRQFGRKPSTARTGTRFRAIGSAPPDIAGEEQSPIMSSVLSVDALLNSGARFIDRVQSYSDIDLQSTINDKATLARAKYGKPLPIITAAVDVAAISPRILGSTQRVRISHPIFPAGEAGAPGYDVMHRVIGLKVRPDERGQSEEAELIFEDVD